MYVLLPCCCFVIGRQHSAQPINFLYTFHMYLCAIFFNPRNACTLSVSVIINTIIRATLSCRPDLQVKCSSLQDNTIIRRVPLSLPAMLLLAILLQIQGAKTKTFVLVEIFLFLWCHTKAFSFMGFVFSFGPSKGSSRTHVVVLFRYRADLFCF